MTTTGQNNGAVGTSVAARGMFLTRLEVDGYVERGFTTAPLGPHDLLVEIAVAGVGFADTLVATGRYQTARPLPFVPGSEGAGRVVAVGGEVTGFGPGDRVMFASLRGSFASHIVVGTHEAVAIPDGLSDEDAASILIPYGTAYYALSLLDEPLTDADTVLVPGATGGVGLAVMSLARSAGAHTIGVVSTPEKAAFLRSRGFDDVVVGYDDRLRDRVEALRAAGGASHVVDAVGGTFTAIGFRALAWRGDYLVLGFAAGDIPSLALNRVLLKEARIRGVYWGRLLEEDPDAYGAILARVAQGYRQGDVEPLEWEVRSMTEVGDAVRDAGARRRQVKLLLRQDLGRISGRDAGGRRDNHE